MGRRRNNRARRSRGGLNVFLILIVISLIVSGVVVYIGMTSSKSTYRNEAIICIDNNEYDKAIEWFIKALEEEQWFTEDVDLDIMYYLAECYIHVGQFDKAIEQYNELISMGKDDSNTQFLKNLASGLSKYSDGDYEEALVILSEAIDKGYNSLYLFTGSCYGLINDYQNMLIEFDKYVKIYGENEYIISQYATAYTNMGNFDKTMEYVNKGLLIEDNIFKNELLLNEIAYYEYMSNYQLAFEKAKEYVSLYPDDEAGKKEYDFLYTRVMN